MEGGPRQCRGRPDVFDCVRCAWAAFSQYGLELGKNDAPYGFAIFAAGTLGCAWAVESSTDDVFANMKMTPAFRNEPVFEWAIPVKAVFRDQPKTSSRCAESGTMRETGGRGRLTAARWRSYSVWVSTLTLVDRTRRLKKIRWLGLAMDGFEVDYKLWIHLGGRTIPQPRCPIRFLVPASSPQLESIDGWMNAGSGVSRMLISALSPAFRDANRLPSPYRAYYEARRTSRKLATGGEWAMAFEIDTWLYTNASKTHTPAELK